MKFARAISTASAHAILVPRITGRGGLLWRLSLLPVVALPLFLSACEDDYSLIGAQSASTTTSGAEKSAVGFQKLATTTTSSSTTKPSRSALSTDPSLVDASCPVLEETVPRGVSCLQCMEQGAIEQRQVFLDLLRETCLKNIALSVVVDNSFSFDEAFLFQAVDALTSGGRRLFLHVYLLNGPSQRKYDTTPVLGSFTRVEPKRFRELLFSNARVERIVRKLVDRVTPAMVYALNKGAVVNLVPMLEDNLQRRSFNRLSEIILDELPAGLEVALGRNPCPRCYPGNDDYVPTGFFAEHHPELPALRFDVVDGVMSNDGVDVGFTPGEVGGRVQSLATIAGLRDTATAQNSLFLFWNAEYQGLQSSRSGISGTAVSPTDRPYAVPTQVEKNAIIQLLRGE